MDITHITKLCNFAAVLACLAFSGCELFEEGDTCKYPGDVNKIWNPDRGFILFVPYTEQAPEPVWFPNLGGEKGKFIIPNICPKSPVKIHIKVLEKFPDDEIDYVIWTAFTYGNFLTFSKPYPLSRTNLITKEGNIELVPSLNGILESDIVVSISLSVKVPFFGNENEAKALVWAKEHIASISIDANFTRYQ